MGAIREYLMAFIFARKNNRGKTWYVGYCVNGRFLRKRVGRSKVIAEKARGDIEAKVERGEAGLLNRDCPILSFFDGCHSRAIRAVTKAMVDLSSGR